MARILQIEERSIDYVPLRERHGKVWQLWPVWFSGDAARSYISMATIKVPAGSAPPGCHVTCTRSPGGCGRSGWPWLRRSPPTPGCCSC